MTVQMTDTYGLGATGVRLLAGGGVQIAYCYLRGGVQELHPPVIR